MTQRDQLVIPRRYSAAKISDLKGDIATVVQEFMTNSSEYMRQGIAPSFFGASGVGKTHAAAAIANRLRDDGIPTYWCSALEDLNKLRDYRSLGKSDDYFIEYKRLTRNTVLIMDDITQIAKFGRVKEQMATIVSKRYNSGLPTIFTGNCSPLKQSFQSTLVAGFGVPMLRRIETMSKGLLYLG